MYAMLRAPRRRARRSARCSRGVSASMWFVDDDYGLRGVRSDDDYTDALAFV